MPHIHEKIDFTAEVFVVFDSKVLLRKHDKYGLWCSVGGHIELDEDPNRAAIREVKEEVGLDIKLDTSHMKLAESKDKVYVELVPPVFLNRHRISDTHEHVSLVYIARSSSDKVVPERETDQWKWLRKEELQSLDLRPTILEYASYALSITS